MFKKVINNNNNNKKRNFWDPIRKIKHSPYDWILYLGLVLNILAFALLIYLIISKRFTKSTYWIIDAAVVLSAFLIFIYHYYHRWQFWLVLLFFSLFLVKLIKNILVIFKIKNFLILY